MWRNRLSRLFTSIRDRFQQLSSNQKIIAIAAAPVVLCCGCLCAFTVVLGAMQGASLSPTDTPSAQRSGPTIDIEDLPPIETDTPAATNTAVPTNTTAPTNTAVPSNTPAPTNTALPTNTPAPTNTTAPTNTAVPVPTPTPLPQPTLAPTAAAPPTEPPPPPPTQPPAPAACAICSYDAYNCGDFSTHAAAQACFEYCVSQGAGDIHGLDRDNDNNVCESMQ